MYGLSSTCFLAKIAMYFVGVADERFVSVLYRTCYPQNMTNLIKNTRMTILLEYLVIWCACV